MQTMSKTSLLLFAALFLVLSTATTSAAEPADSGVTSAKLGVLIDAIRADRKALVAVNLDLTAAEADAFWPLYDRYQKEINAISDRVAAVVEDYTTHFHDLSNDKALQLIRDYLSAEAERASVRRTYLDQFEKILPGRKVARFYQIENKMDAVLRYDVASTIPVVEEEGRAPAK
jgi:hypothetical protein